MQQPEEWGLYGVRFQTCPPVYNNSVTHSDWRQRQVVKLVWRSDRSVGHIQF